MNIIRNIYSWLNPIYGNELYEYLKGNDCNGVFTGPNHLLTISSIMIVISFFLFLMYYYIINHPRFNRWYNWISFLLITGIINLLVGFGYTYSKLNGGFIPACFTHSQIQTAGDQTFYGVAGSEILFNSNCWQFGIANAIFSIVVFTAFSFFLRNWSRNCKLSPVTFSR